MAMAERAKPSSSSRKKTSLLFQGDVSAESSPLPENTTPADLTNFFHDADSRLAFASGGDPSSAEELELTPEWESRWKQCCNRWYGSAFLPQRGDCVFECQEFSSFPGLTVCTTVYAGFKTMQTKGVPGCCFLVIGQKQTAKGLPPIVWVFNQLMGKKTTKKKESNNNNENDMEAVLDPWGPIKSFYSVEKQSTTGRWVFRLHSSMQMQIEFPSRLLKILPSSKARVEAQGSAGITKTIAKAGQKGVTSVREAFVKHQSQQQELEAAVNERRSRRRIGFGGVGLLPIAY
ncbi:expressed unknown protein [Seminavis robusta]|uniref:Uncharacterized protein n=1 Tax=Seminavis robusta TaxID=568900 RepID=A0A9N8DG53_9STRA|nr:expressed unknown protein [Seminavis robusta]|eukprot:Sro109_g054550.1 n/a (289) ;mRNA; r:62217-63083